MNKYTLFAVLCFAIAILGGVANGYPKDPLGSALELRDNPIDRLVPDGGRFRRSPDDKGKKKDKKKKKDDDDDDDDDDDSDDDDD